MSKTCTKCGVVKPLDDFHRNKDGAGGRRSYCKECVREYTRRYYEENRDKVRERKCRYREENRDKVRESERRYREENRDKVRKSQRRYYEENRDKELDYQRRYREENRDKTLDYKRRYYEENRDKELDYKRRYYEENRDILNQGSKIRQVRYTRTSSLLASKKGAPYSPEEDALILAENGMTTYQKAIELGRTYASVKVRKQHLRARANQRETPFGELETTTHERGTNATTS